MNRTSASRTTLFLLLMVMTALLAPLSAKAVVAARVTLRGGTISDTTVGGPSEVTAQFEDVGSISGPSYTLTTGGDLISDATRGRLEGAIFSEVEIVDSSAQLSAFVEKYVFQQDTYTIGAGTTGLSNGDPVQVRVQARLVGRLTLNGRPSGVSELLFSITGVPGVPGRWVDWNTGTLNPPQDIRINETWSTIIDTTVGASFTLSSNLESTMNGTAFDGPVVDGNHANGTGLIRVEPSPGLRGSRDRRRSRRTDLALAGGPNRVTGCADPAGRAAPRDGLAPGSPGTAQHPRAARGLTHPGGIAKTPDRRFCPRRRQVAPRLRREPACRNA